MTNSDGIYVRGELRRGGGLDRLRRRVADPGGAGARPRDPRDGARRDPAARHRLLRERRQRGHQRQRRSPRPPGDRHRRRAGRGEGERSCASRSAMAGPSSTPTTRAPGRCAARRVPASTPSAGGPDRRGRARRSTAVGGLPTCENGWLVLRAAGRRPRHSWSRPPTCRSRSPGCRATTSPTRSPRRRHATRSASRPAPDQGGAAHLRPGRRGQPGPPQPVRARRGLRARRLRAQRGRAGRADGGGAGRRRRGHACGWLTAPPATGPTRSSTGSASLAAAADDLVIAEKRHYLRGRDLEEMNEILRDGAREGGYAGEIEALPTELSALQALTRAGREGRRRARSWPTSSAPSCSTGWRVRAPPWPSSGCARSQEADRDEQSLDFGHLDGLDSRIFFVFDAIG